MIVGTFTFFNESDILIMQIEQMLYLCDHVIIQADNPTADALEIAESYARDGLVTLIVNEKEYEDGPGSLIVRDEHGDRENLLIEARKLGAKACYHMDADEMIRLADLEKVKKLFGEYKYDHIMQFSKCDFWHNMHNYRISYHSNENAGKEVPYADAPIKHDAVFPVTARCTFREKPVPNMGSYRVPYFYENGTPNVVYYKDIYVTHFGYYCKSKVDAKAKYYEFNRLQELGYQSGGVTTDVWQEDMQIDDKTFMERFGMGFLPRQ